MPASFAGRSLRLSLNEQDETGGERHVEYIAPDRNPGRHQRSLDLSVRRRRPLDRNSLADGFRDRHPAPDRHRWHGVRLLLSAAGADRTKPTPIDHTATASARLPQ